MQFIKISPIFYMGNKRRLIGKGLIEFFPKNINNFYEPFAGSCIVSMNVLAKNYFINDIMPQLYDLYSMFKNYTADKIISHINNRIDAFNLPRERTKRNVYLDLEKINEYKENYIRFRNFYNQDRNIIDLYVLMFYSFSQSLRFNSNNEFNMPFGCDCYTLEHNLYINEGVSFFSKPNIHLYNMQFDTFLNQFNINKNDFIYFDPPYFGSSAVYNENREGNPVWSELDEMKFRQLCENLNQKNIKFAISNIYKNKDFDNVSLKNWVEQNNFYVYHFNNFSYIFKGIRSDTDGVLITNYKTGKTNSISHKLF